MKQRVVGKQENCSDCMVCGLENKFGLQASFFELESGEVVAIFRPQEQHQSYPGRLHGRMAAAVLDETIGRAVMIKNRGVWGVTAELSLRYLLPVPLEGELRAVGRITRDTRRLFECTGEILLPNGDVAVSAFGKLGQVDSEDLRSRSTHLPKMPRAYADHQLHRGCGGHQGHPGPSRPLGHSLQASRKGPYSALMPSCRDGYGPTHRRQCPFWRSRLPLGGLHNFITLGNSARRGGLCG